MEKHKAKYLFIKLKYSFYVNCNRMNFDYIFIIQQNAYCSTGLKIEEHF